jgi:hypothetical protein
VLRTSPDLVGRFAIAHRLTAARSRGCPTPAIRDADRLTDRGREACSFAMSLAARAILDLCAWLSAALHAEGALSVSVQSVSGLLVRMCLALHRHVNFEVML